MAKLITGLPSNQAVSWESIVALAKRQFDHVWTRQALQAHPDIKNAYSEHGKLHSQFCKTGKTPRATAPEIDVLQQKLDKEQAENAQNRETLRQYDELLCTYVTNALKHGISPEQLAAPLVRPYRAQSDSPRPRTKKARQSRNS
ncbi:hypothetical protein [Paraburkholderia ribeironis]|uniref:hypothetical protein n=1 Tax=Paraburkholderia ribeironis TaxID=1247936 RepID=UPI0011775E3B|nr:hypothetical protein [Paraburkholderia ribeironis]